MILMSLLRRAAIGLAVVLATAVSEPAAAQNYDSALLMKFGVFGQAGHGKFKVTAPLNGDRGTSTGSGLSGGVTWGLDYSPMKTWLLGVEWDGAVGDIGSKQVGLTSANVDWLTSLRLRAGHYVHPDTLLYIATGPAIGGVEWKNRLIAGGPVTRQFESLHGWNIGAGVEWNWNHVLMFAEYGFTGYGERSFTVNNGTTPGSVGLDTHLFRLGMKFKIGWDHYHDDYADRGRKPVK